ncbi:MAG TPA: ABC transporter permease [bacterium]|nr:ABC transporter permease [bacterium]
MIALERREAPHPWASFAIPLLSIALALAAGAVVLWLAGVNPLAAYADLLGEPFGSGFGIGETLVKATPLILTGLAVLLPARMKLWNIGAEGQLQLGAIGAAWMALFTPIGHSAVAMLAVVVAGMVAGALWALAAGALRAWLDVNETITTLLMNYIALLFVDHLIYGPWKDPASRGFPLSATFPQGARLPFIIPGTRVHLGLLLALVAVVIVTVALYRTRWGLEVRVIGDNPRAARYTGMSLVRHTLLIMGIAGALAGLAGVGEASAIAGRLQRGLSPGYGYTAIIVAWLAKLNPVAVVIVAVLLGGLYLGGDSLQISLGLPIAVVNMLQGLIFFFVLGGEVLAGYRVAIGRRRVAPISTGSGAVR